MIFTYRICESYVADIAIEADSEADAMLEIDDIQEDSYKSRILDRFLENGYYGRTYELIHTDEKGDADFRAARR